MKTTEPTTTEIPTQAKDFFSSLESLRVTESTAAPLVKLYWFSVNWKKPWCELRNGRFGFDG